MAEAAAKNKAGDGSTLQAVIDKKDEKIPYEVVEEERIPGSRARFKLKLSEETLEPRLKETLKEVGRQVRIPGFRPGKAPQALIRKSYDAYAREETVKRMVQRLCELYTEEKGYEPLAPPYLLSWKSNKDEGTSLEIALEIAPNIEITDELLGGLSVEAHKVPIDDALVEHALEQLRKQNATYEPTEDGYQEGDGLLFTCEVKDADGNIVPERSVKEYYSTKVEEEVPEEVAKTLVGKKKGDHLSMDLEEESDLDPSAKEKVHYEFDVLEVKRRTIPELDDEFAQDVNEKHETLDDLRKAVAESAEKQEENRRREEILGEILKKLGERLDFDLPRAMVENTTNRSISEMEQRLNQWGTSFRTMDSTILQNYAANMQQQARENVRNYLIIKAVGKHLAIEPTEENIKAELDRIAEQTGRKALAVRAQLEANKQWDQFIEDLKLRITNDRLIEQAEVALKEISAKDLEELQRKRQEEQAAKLRGEAVAEAQAVAEPESTEQ